jgi:EasF-like predicted methyltransferase
VGRLLHRPIATAVVDTHRNLRKTKILLDALEELGRPVDYFALDVSYPELERTLRPVTAGVYQHVRCFGLLGTYDDCRKWLDNPDLQSRPKSILYLGSTLGNFEKGDASQFLASFAQTNCSFLLGLDGCKDESKVLQAYNDIHGINHRFIKNGLAHANTMLGNDMFDLETWDVAGRWDAKKGAHYQYYYPRADVSLDGIHIPAGRRLLAVRSHKYDADDREELYQKAGLSLVNSWSAAVSGYSESVVFCLMWSPEELTIFRFIVLDEKSLGLVVKKFWLLHSFILAKGVAEGRSCLSYLSTTSTLRKAEK